MLPFPPKNHFSLSFFPSNQSIFRRQKKQQPAESVLSGNSQDRPHFDYRVLNRRVFFGVRSTHLKKPLRAIMIIVEELCFFSQRWSTLRFAGEPYFHRHIFSAWYSTEPRDPRSRKREKHIIKIWYPLCVCELSSLFKCMVFCQQYTFINKLARHIYVFEYVLTQKHKVFVANILCCIHILSKGGV